MPVLVLNAGSSSLKFSLIDASTERELAGGSVDLASRPPRYEFRAGAGAGRGEAVSWSGVDEAVARIARDLAALDPPPGIDAVVHRVVHGGTRFTAPVVVDDEVRQALGGLVALAPLHNPPNLETLDAARAAWPEPRHVAVFDTAFHATLAAEAYTYPLPYDWTVEWGLRRFGFHGFSHAYCAARAAEMLGAASARRIVIAHLGNGASVTAVRDGASVDTSMGFTPLEGLMMGTRSGSVDPGVLLHVQTAHGVSVERLRRALNLESGLAGVSGIASDMRQVLEAAHLGHERAQLAVQMFAHRARQAVGACAVTLGGVDALVFTGGIGEHSGEVRAAIAEGLACLGLELDTARNEAARPDAVVSRPGSPGAMLVVATREELMMARAVTRA